MIRTASLFFASALLLPAQWDHVLNVDGEAEVLVAPDHVVISLGVESTGSTPGAALAANSGVIGKLIELARKSNVADRDLKTDYIQFQVQHAAGASIPVDYYVARKSLVVTLRDLSGFEPFLTAALTAGATHLHGVDFRTSELRKYRDQARAMAVKAASEKARDMAAAVGRKVNDRPVEIISSQADAHSWYGSGWSPGYGRQQAMMQNVSVAANDGPGVPLEGSVAFGRISVTARVNAKFAIE